jgi:RHS repeat-associated protein
LALPAGETVVRTGAGSAYNFEITDQHGTSTLTLDSTAANPAWRQFTPYGAARGQAPPSWPDTNGFLSKPTDPNTALTIIGARQYDPVAGRFLSVDPVLSSDSPQQLDGYTYAADDPVSASDPTGLMPCVDNVCGSYQWLEHHFANSGGGGGGGGGQTGGGGSSAPSDPYYFYPVTPAYYSGPAGFINRLLATPAPVQHPVTHPTAAPSRQATATGSVLGPDCNGVTFRLGACPSERGAAGTTPAEVKQSLIGAGLVVLSAVPISDLVGGLFGLFRGAGAVADAAPAAARAATPVAERATAVIGRLPDTSVARDWAGHEVLDLPDWTLAKNDEWVQSVVDRKMPVYVGSNPTWENLWDVENDRPTIFARELGQFTKAGYTWDGWTMMPPGGG